MGNIFVDLEGFEGLDPIMLRRTLLEFVVIRYAVSGKRSVPLKKLLAEASLLKDGNVAPPVILRAVAQNKVVFIDHPDMYGAHSVNKLKDLEVVIGCDAWLVAKWVAKAGGEDHVYSLNATSQDIRNKMTEELDSGINRLKSHLPNSTLELDQGYYTRQ